MLIPTETINVHIPTETINVHIPTETINVHGLTCKRKYDTLREK